jgi:hypothetical protein
MRKRSESGRAKKKLDGCEKKLARGNRVAYQYGRVGRSGMKWDSEITGEVEKLESWGPADVPKSLHTRAR